MTRHIKSAVAAFVFMVLTTIVLSATPVAAQRQQWYGEPRRQVSTGYTEYRTGSWFLENLLYALLIVLIIAVILGCIWGCIACCKNCADENVKRHRHRRRRRRHSSSSC